MIIDFHTHTFPDAIAEAALGKLAAASRTKPFTDGTMNGLAASMARAGIDASVLMPVATRPAQVPHINDSAILVNQAACATGIYSFGAMHPDYEDYKNELQRLKQEGIRGIKLHPPYQGARFDDARYGRILEEAGRLDLVVLIHAGLDVGLPGVNNASPDMILRALDSAGKVCLVLAHMGGWRLWDRLDGLRGRGLYLDTSFSLGTLTPLKEGALTAEEMQMLSDEDFMQLCREFGCDHVLFGTDSPWADQAEALHRFNALSFSPEERENILGGNAKRLLKIS